jgi:hypothetical protein
MYERLITNLLERYNVSYWTEGKNVSVNSINIQCPFYDCGDHSNHMGIFRDTLIFHCWKCGKKGHFSYLLKILTGKTGRECETEIEEEKILLNLSEEKKTPKETKLEASPLPKYFERIYDKIDSPLLHKYLRRRNLYLDFIIDKGCGICRVGYYMNRMIIPIYFEGKQVSFVAADMTGKARVKYDTPGTVKYLYNYDDIEEGKTIIIVEGILDAWRVGKEATAILSSHLTDKQKTWILQKRPKNMVFCMDGDAFWHAKDEASFFEPFVDRVEVVHLPFEEDPDSLGTEEIWKMINNELHSVDDNYVSMD